MMMMMRLKFRTLRLFLFCLQPHGKLCNFHFGVALLLFTDLGNPVDVDCTPLERQPNSGKSKGKIITKPSQRYSNSDPQLSCQKPLLSSSNWLRPPWPNICHSCHSLYITYFCVAKFFVYRIFDIALRVNFADDYADFFRERTDSAFQTRNLDTLVKEWRHATSAQRTSFWYKLRPKVNFG